MVAVGMRPSDGAEFADLPSLRQAQIEKAVLRRASARIISYIRPGESLRLQSDHFTQPAWAMAYNTAFGAGQLIAKPAPYQPSQGYFLLDQRHAPAEDFKLNELTWAVAQLERSRTANDLAQVARRLAPLLASPSEDELRRTFVDWLSELWRPLVASDPARRPPDNLDLGDMTMSLVDRVAEWPKPYIEQGREQAWCTSACCCAAWRQRVSTRPRRTVWLPPSGPRRIRST